METSSGWSTAFTCVVSPSGAMDSTIAETMDVKTCLLVVPPDIACWVLTLAQKRTTKDTVCSPSRHP